MSSRRIEYAGFLAARPIGVDDGRHFSVGIDGPKGRQVLFALARVDRDRLVQKAILFQKERDLCGSWVDIEANNEAIFHCSFRRCNSNAATVPAPCHLARTSSSRWETRSFGGTTAASF